MTWSSKMDDNIIKVGVLNANNRNFHPEGTNPGMVFRLISELVWSTNVGMGGPQLSSIRPQLKAKTIRPGFPYSAFFEKVTLYRPPYFGPFEDDIMHAMDYGLGHSPLTTGVVPTLTYAKESSSSSGMRKHYDATRGLELTRRYPLNASLQVGPKTSSPNDTDKGVRHYLNTKGFTPIRVTDRERFLSAQETLVEWVNAGMERFKESTRPKIRERAGMGE